MQYSFEEKLNEKNGWGCPANPEPFHWRALLGSTCPHLLWHCTSHFPPSRQAIMGRTLVRLSKRGDHGLNGAMSERQPQFLPTTWHVSPNKGNGFEFFLSPACCQISHRRVYILRLSLKLRTGLYSQWRFGISRPCYFQRVCRSHSGCVD